MRKWIRESEEMYLETILRLQQRKAGVRSVDVSLEAGTATVEAADSVTDEALVAAVADAGYEASVA